MDFRDLVVREPQDFEAFQAIEPVHRCQLVVAEVEELQTVHLVQPLNLCDLLHALAPEIERDPLAIVNGAQRVRGLRGTAIQACYLGIDLFALVFHMLLDTNDLLHCRDFVSDCLPDSHACVVDAHGSLDGLRGGEGFHVLVLLAQDLDGEVLLLFFFWWQDRSLWLFYYTYVTPSRSIINIFWWSNDAFDFVLSRKKQARYSGESRCSHRSQKCQCSS